MLGTDTCVRIFETRNNRTILGTIQSSFAGTSGIIRKIRGSRMIETRNKELLL